MWDKAIEKLKMLTEGMPIEHPPSILSDHKNIIYPR